MTTTVSLSQAVSLAVTRASRPVLSSYTLGVLIFKLIGEGSIDGRTLRLGEPQRRHFTQAVNFLVGYGVLSPVRGLAKGTAYVTAGSPTASAMEIACSVDPFAYVSHLSAMEMHGLTNRISQTLFLSSPERSQWRSFADARLNKDLGDDLERYLDSGFPTLTRTKMEKIEDRVIHLSQSLHTGAFRRSSDSDVRVATLGRTFLDMLREPYLCGGIHHVLDVYKEYAGQYLSLIVDEVDQHGAPIDRVRAGYVLEEICGLSHPSIAAWQKSVARGGSRKLVASNEYSPQYSERWALSLNAD